MHRAVVGRTGMGKSRMLRERIIPAWIRQRRPVYVLDPVGQAWGATWQTDDPYLFLEVVQRSRGCVLVIDECDEMLRASGEQERALKYLATRSRNDGHLAYFLAQRLMQIPPSYRNQCSWGYVFNQVEEDAQEARKLFGEPILEQATTLPPGVCYHVRPLSPPTLIKVF